MELTFDTGLVTYTLNGKVDVQFNPTDGSFVERLYNTFEALDAKQETYRKEVEKVQGKREIFDVARKQDSEMREMINGVFDKDICTPLFGDLNVYALADGLPVWCNLIMSIMDVCDASFDSEKEKMTPRVKKYTDKYQKKYHR